MGVVGQLIGAGNQGDGAVFVAGPVFVFNAGINQHHAFLGAHILKHLEDGFQFLIGHVGIDDGVVARILVVLGNAVAGIAALGQSANPGVIGFGVNFLVLSDVGSLEDVGPRHGGNGGVAGDNVRLHLAVGGEHVGIQQAFVEELLAHFQRFDHAGLQQGVGYFAVADDDVVAQHDVIGSGDGGQTVDAPAGEADGVLDAVAIGIVVGQEVAVVIQLVHGGGNLQIGILFVPVVANQEHQVVVADGLGGGDGIHFAVIVQGGNVGVFAVGTIDGVEHVGVAGQGQQHILSGIGAHLVSIAEEHVPIVTAHQTGSQRGVIFIQVNNAEVNAGAGQNGLVHKVVLQIGRSVVGVVVGVADDGYGFFSAGVDQTEGQHHHGHEQQRDELLHSVSPF